MKFSILLLLFGTPMCGVLGYFMGKPGGTASSTPGGVPYLTPAGAVNASTVASTALDAIRANADILDRRLALLSLVENADSGDLRRIFTSARLTNDVSARNAAAQRWAEIDPASLHEHLLSLPTAEMEELNEVATILYHTWARRDRSAALAAARKDEGRDGFDRARWAAVSAVLEEDPEAGFALVMSEKNLRPGQNLHKSLWEKDPARFIRAAATLGKGDNPNMWALQSACDAALMEWSGMDFPGALTWAQSLNSNLRAEIIPKLLGKLASTDINQARVIFESLPPSAEREAVGPSIVSQWAKTDPQAALDWIEEKMTSGRGAAYVEWMRAIAEDGLPRAAQLLESLPDGNGRDRATRALATTWAAKDFSGALGWVRGMSDPGARRDALSSILSQWSQKDPASLRDFVTTAPLGDLPHDFYYVLRSTGSAPEREQQLLWAAGLPEDRRNRAFDYNLYFATYNRGPEETVSLLQKIPDAALQQRGGTQVFENMVSSNPERATKFLDGLPPEILGAEMRQRMRQAVENQSSLAPDEKAGLLSRLK